MVEHSAVNRRVPGSSPGRGAKADDPPVTFWVYVLLNPREEIYIGQTSQLAVRLAQHNDPEYRGTLHTKRHPRSLEVGAPGAVWDTGGGDAPGARTEEPARSGMDSATPGKRLLIRRLTDSQVRVLAEEPKLQSAVFHLYFLARITQHARTHLGN